MSTTARLTRRQWLTVSSALLLAPLGLGGLAGCGRREPPVRVATNVWPGYEFMYVAHQQGLFGDAPVIMQAMPSATACLQALAAGSAEAAGLTLDEVLSARADNMPLTIIAVLDVSHGGDVLLARPEIGSLAGLRGRRIGVEQSAVGAVMLDAALKAAGLDFRDVDISYATVDRHLDLFRTGRVDAIVTFEPVPQRLKAGEAISLFDSRQIPDRILDVLAVRPEVLRRSPQALRALIQGHFQALQRWKEAPSNLAPLIAERLDTDIDEVSAAFAGLQLPDVATNHEWLGGARPRLHAVAEDLQQRMLAASLIAQPASLEALSDARFLP